MIGEDLEDTNASFLTSTNAAFRDQTLSLKSALRLAIAKTVIPDLIDFLLSPGNQGLRMAEVVERFET